MKEISQELLDRRCAICTKCGAIFEDCDTIFKDCPECGAKPGPGAGPRGLYYITPSHSWIGST